MTDDAQREPVGPLRSVLGRRQAIRVGVLGGAGLATAALIGCSDDDDGDGEPSGSNGGSQATATGTATAVDHPDGDYDALAEADGSPYSYNYPEPSGDPKPGGTLTYGVSWDVGVWDTNKSSASQSHNIGNLAANRLIGMVTGPQMSKYRIDFEPELAESWESSPDGLTYTFHLRSGVKYQNVDPINGREFKAQDVVESYERSKAGGSNQAYFQLVDTITAPDDATVVIKMNTPDADFLVPLAGKWLPIYPPELYENDLIDTKPIGTGPAILVEASNGNVIRFESNPDYFEGKPHLDGLEFRIMPDTAARQAAFRAGQLDFAAGLPTSEAEIDALMRSNPGLQITADPILAGVSLWGINPGNPKFQDERVRQAMLLAVNRDALVEVLYQGNAKVMPAFGWPFVFDEIPTGDQLGRWFRHAPDEARQLLQAAGAEGLSWRHKYTSALGPTFEQINGLMVDFFREVGLDMQPENLDQTTFNQWRFTRKFADEGGETILGFSTDAPSANGYFYNKVHSKSPTNYFATSDPEVDEWATQQRSEMDPDARREILRKIWDKVLDGAYRLELPTQFSPTITQPWVRYYRFNGPYIGIHVFNDIGMGFHEAWLDK